MKGKILEKSGRKRRLDLGHLHCSVKGMASEKRVVLEEGRPLAINSFTL